MQFSKFKFKENLFSDQQFSILYNFHDLYLGINSGDEIWNNCNVSVHQNIENKFIKWTTNCSVGSRWIVPPQAVKYNEKKRCFSGKMKNLIYWYFNIFVIVFETNTSIKFSLRFFKIKKINPKIYCLHFTSNWIYFQWALSIWHDEVSLDSLLAVDRDVHLLRTIFSINRSEHWTTNRIQRLLERIVYHLDIKMSLVVHQYHSSAMLFKNQL